MPQLSVEEIKKVLAEGNSVFVRDSNGQIRHVTSPDRMPTEAELAKGDQAAALQSLEFSQEVGGFKKGQLEALEKKIDSLVADARKREQDAAKGLQSQIDELRQKLAGLNPEPTKPAPAQAAPVAAKVEAPKAPEVKK